MFVVPGLKAQPVGEMKTLMDEWAGDEVYMFRTKDWWEEHIKDACEDEVEIKVYESAHYEQVWQEWFDCGHEYGIRDKEFLDKGLKDILNFVMLVIKRK